MYPRSIVAIRYESVEVEAFLDVKEVPPEERTSP
jgi:hypothetical protein